MAVLRDLVMAVVTDETVKPGAVGHAVLADENWKPIPDAETVEFVNGEDDVLFQGCHVVVSFDGEPE